MNFQHGSRPFSVLRGVSWFLNAHAARLLTLTPLMLMVSTWKMALLAFVSFAAAIAIQVTLEKLGYSDSVGWWYTIYSSFIYLVPIFILFVVISRLVSPSKNTPRE